MSGLSQRSPLDGVAPVSPTLSLTHTSAGGVDAHGLTLAGNASLTNANDWVVVSVFAALTKAVQFPGAASSTTTCSTVFARSRALSGMGSDALNCDRVAAMNGLRRSRCHGVYFVPSGPIRIRSRSC